MLRPLGGHQGIHLMNASIHRAGLAIAALAVVTMIGGIFIADGYLHARGQPTSGPAVGAAQEQPAPTAAAGTAPPEVVYVRPAPPPAVIHVTQVAPRPPKRIVHVTVPGTGGEHDSESGAGNDGAGG
jgi:hypothetical protein